MIIHPDLSLQLRVYPSVLKNVSLPFALLHCPLHSYGINLSSTVKLTRCNIMSWFSFTHHKQKSLKKEHRKGDIIWLDNDTGGKYIYKYTYIHSYTLKIPSWIDYLALTDHFNVLHR